MNRFLLLFCAHAYRDRIVPETDYLLRYLQTFGLYGEEHMGTIVMAEYDAARERAENGT